MVAAGLLIGHLNAEHDTRVAACMAAYAITPAELGTMTADQLAARIGTPTAGDSCPGHIEIQRRTGSKT